MRVLICLLPWLCCACIAQNVEPYLLYDCEGGICTEWMWSDSSAVTDYDADNHIYRPGREFVYDYYYVTPTGDTTLIGLEGYRTDPLGTVNSATITEVSFHVDSAMGARMREMIPDYTQSGLNYDYYGRDETSFYPKEGSGVVENERNVWIHPFRRDLYFAMLNSNPYPFVRLPLEAGKEWTWELTISGDKYLNALWTDATESTLREHTYRVLGEKTFTSSFAGELRVWEIAAKATGPIGASGLNFYFHEDYGFVWLHYTNLRGSQFVFTLREIRER